MSMSGRRKSVLNLIALSVVGIITGLFLGGDLLPSQSANQLYDKKITTTSITSVVSHSHDVTPLHEHTTTTVTTTTETTPHGYVHNFSLATAEGATPAVTPAITPAITPAVTPAAPAAPIPSQSPREVWILGRQMIPADITVPVGTTITWINRDTDIHTITSDSFLFDKELPPDDSFSFTFTEKGIFPYHCEPHPEITGTVVVE